MNGFWWFVIGAGVVAALVIAFYFWFMLTITTFR